MPDPTFTEAPAQVPSRAAPSTFSALTDPFIAWEKTFRNELSSSVSWFALQASNAAASASAASDSAGEAADSAGAASDSADDAALSAALSISGGAAAAGADVHVPNAAYTASNPASAAVSNVNGQTYRCIVSHSGVATDPANDATNWVRITFNGAYADLSGKPTLGTAATKNTGTTDGTVPLIGAGDKLPESILPEATPGGLVPIGSKQTLSSVAAADILLTGGYDEYIIKYWGFYNDTDNFFLRLRTSTNGGSSFDSGGSDYKYAIMGINSDSTSNSNSVSGASSFIALSSTSVGTTAANNVSGEIKIYTPSDTTPTKIETTDTTITAMGRMQQSIGGGFRNSSAVVDAVRLFMSSGNIAAGEYQLYGVTTV